MCINKRKIFGFPESEEMSVDKVVCTVVILFFALSTGKVKQLPPYITACRLNDPEINNCIRDHANEVLPKLKNGDPEFKLSSISPFRVDEAKIHTSTNFNLRIKDIDVFGLDDLKILTANFNKTKDNYYLRISASTPQMKTIGDYEVTGRVLILPINGKGKSNVTFDNVVMHYDIKSREVDKKGVKVIQIDDIKLDFDSSRIYVYFENLFNGDKRLGDEMNFFLNENWKIIFDEVRPDFSKIVENIIYSYVKQVVDRVPADKVFIR